MPAMNLLEISTKFKVKFYLIRIHSGFRFQHWYQLELLVTLEKFIYFVPEPDTFWFLEVKPLNFAYYGSSRQAAALYRPLTA